MKTFQTTLTLTAALFAMPAMAQADLAPEKKTMRFEMQIDSEDARFGVVVISCDPATVVFDGKLILRDAAAVMLARKKDDKFVLEMDLPASLPFDLYWQGAIYDAKSGVRIDAIQKLDRDAQSDSDQPAQKRRPADETSAAETSDARPNMDPSAPSQSLPMDLTLEDRQERGFPRRLIASFTAPSDDYALTVVSVDWNQETGTVDVYLYRKVPGEGEGLRDVVEQHSVTVELHERQQVRVFLAEGTEHRTSDATAWKLLATLPK